jgi:transposase
MRSISMDANERLLQELQEKLRRTEASLSNAQAALNETQASLFRAESKLDELSSHHSAVTEQFAQTIDEKNHQIALLEQKIKRLLSNVKGSRQERINPDQLLLLSPEELNMLSQELESQAAQEEAEQADLSVSEEKKKSKPTGRRKLPSNLPREVRRYELSEEQRKCPCCGDTRQEMGVESSEQLEFVPAVFKIIEHQRVQYACKNCQENVAIADKPPQPIEKGVPGPGLCSYVVLSKFGDHLPLYREEDLFNRMGWDLRRSTICQWLGTLGVLVDPLIDRMKHLVLQSKVIHTDDTKIKLMDLGTCQEAKFWPYLGDWLHPYVVFDFTQDRKRYGPKNFLKDFKGYLQADAYAGYDCVYTSGKVKEVACWIHARRYWHEARDNDSKRANIALGYIARLAQIESQLREVYPNCTLQGERDFEAVASARQQHSLPILHEFKKWLDSELNEGRILPKSLIKSAFTYTLNQWDALCRYTEAGYLTMDNNAAERLVKYPAIGRRNYLFVGNDRAGCNAANFYSLVTSAKLNGVEPFQWLRAIFEELPKYRDGLAFSQSEEGLSVTSTELDHLLPDRWLKAHPEHQWTIDVQRRKEREQTEKRRKQLRNRRKTK